MSRNPAPPLDTETWQRINRVFANASRGGTSLAEQLNNAGLIVTPGLRNQMAVAGVELLIKHLDTITPAQMLRRVNKGEASSPADMYRAMLGFLAEFADQLRKEGL